MWDLQYFDVPKNFIRYFPYNNLNELVEKKETIPSEDQLKEFEKVPTYFKYYI